MMKRNIFSRLRNAQKADAPTVSQEEIAALPEFQYNNTLQGQSIRLIKLEDGEFDDPIQCTLETHSLDGSTRYEALSYVWGDPHDTIPISCAGRRLHVTRNLHAALRRMRMMNDLRKHAPLWIDAVCINQGNVDEKTVQVRLMGEIYAGASLVRIWLRDVPQESVADTFEGVKMMKMVDSEIMRIEKSQKADGMDDVAYRSVEAYSKKHRLDPTLQWLKIIKVVTTGWFNRIWVLQEFVRASAIFVHIGQIITQWEIIFRVAKNMSRSRSWGIISAPYARHMEGPHALVLNAGSFLPIGAAFERGQAKKLHELARETVTFAATDKRDKIFALVGLSCDTRGDFIDYNLSVRDILINVAKNALSAYERDHSALDYLSFVQHEERDERDSHGKALNLPSWVADFTRDRYPISHNYHPLALIFSMPQLPPLEKYFTVLFGSDESLTVHAALLDEVQEIVTRNPYKLSLEMIMSPQQYNDFAQWMAEWMAMVEASTKALNSNPVGKTVQQALAETLGFAHEKSDFGIPGGTIVALKNLQELIPLLPHIRSTLKTRELGGDSDPQIMKRVNEIATATKSYIRAFDTFSKGRYFCVTKRGYLGWVPEAAQVGDLVYAVQWSLIPYVLRRLGSAYTLVGDSYIHQHMSGETLRKLWESAEPIKIL